MTKLTDTRIFEPELVCTVCQRPLPTGDEPREDECDLSHRSEFVRRDYQEFLPGAMEQGPIVMRREEGIGALANIEQKFVVHSPTGFEWGYGGSGPADLALNILALFVPPPEAWRLHQHFKRDVIAALPDEGGVLEPQAIRDWIVNFWSEHPTSP